MSDSNYYYKLYKEKKKEASSYEGDLKDLKKILSNLTDRMSDEIRNINDELEALKSDLDKSARHNSQFDKNANAATADREKVVTADVHLKNVVRELNEEISRVGKLKSQAESDSAYYYNMYEQKKREEDERARQARQAWLESLKFF